MEFYAINGRLTRSRHRRLKTKQITFLALFQRAVSVKNPIPPNAVISIATQQARHVTCFHSGIKYDKIVALFLDIHR